MFYTHFHSSLLLIINIIDVQDRLLLQLIILQLDRLILLLNELVVSFDFLSECVLDYIAHAFQLTLEILQLLVARRDRLLYKMTIDYVKDLIKQ